MKVGPVEADEDRRPWILEAGGTTLLVLVKVIPGASRTAPAGIRPSADGPALLVRIAAAPEKGKANEELLSWLSGYLGQPRRSLELRSGHTSRLKRVAMPASCLARLEALVSPPA